MALSAEPGPAIGIDPGRDKCGYALVEWPNPELRPHLIAAGIAPTSEIGSEIARLRRMHPQAAVAVVGDGTGSTEVVDRVAASCPGLTIALIDERGTSEQARALYLMRNPPHGLTRLLPRGLRTPETPYDDVVAELLAQKFLESQQKNLQQ